MIEPTQKFSISRQFFHWTIALILVFHIPFAWLMVDLPDGPAKIDRYMLHKSLGIVLFSLAVARLIWALLSRRPKLPADTPHWEKVLAKISQALLYILVCLMPISGWMMSSFADSPVTVFGLFTLPMLVPPDPSRVENFSDMNEIQSWILLTVLSLHIVGAMKHHFILKNNVLRTMLPFGELDR
jgi:cytochrome b561